MFLSLVGLTALLVGGVGIGNAVGGYVVTERMLKMFVLAGKKKGP